MTTQNGSAFLRTLTIAVAAFGCAVGLLLPASLNVAHGSGLDGSSKTSGSHVHVASLLVSDLPEGSRVLITADQALNGYEAYQRGDRFYVNIPLSRISSGDSIRARSFTDIQVEQTSTGTLVSFRLQPGVTAHANLYRYKLEIVFAASRARTIVPATIAGSATNSNPRLAPRNGVGSITATPKTGPAAASKAMYTPARKIDTAHSSINTAAPVIQEQDETSVSEESSPKLGQSSDVASTDSVSSVNHVPTTIPVAAVPNSRGDSGKDRANYWLQVARHNPLPVGGGASLLLVIGLLIGKGRKAKSMPATEELAEVLPGMPETTTEAAASAKVIDTDETQIPKPRTEDRVAQEEVINDAIAKLVLDNTHRADIMDSRSPNDRKAIEACLIKVIAATESSENDRRRARQALEEYGFVAQHSAALLKGADAWERSSAARTLGLIGSKTSMAFLIEALNDSDCVVRNEAVTSLAALKDPAAIGALLEAARKHPDVPATLLSATLSACSVESLEIPEVPSAEAASMTGTVQPRNDDSQWHEEADDEVLTGWLALLDNPSEDSCTNEVLEVPMPPQIAQSMKERPYLRVVA